MKRKSILCAVLSLCLVSALSVSAFAADITAAGGGASIPVQVTTGTGGDSPLLFRVTMPTAISVNMTKDGEVTAAVGDIVNGSAGTVKVSDLTIQAAHGWEVDNFDSQFGKLPVDSNHIGLSINGCKTTGADAIAFDGSAFKNDNGDAYMWAGTGNGESAANNSIDLQADAKLSAHSTALSGVTAANVTFTVSWYTGN